MTTQHSASQFITLCTALILLCCAVPAQAQSEAPANEQNTDIPVEWFRLLPAQAGEGVLVGAKQQPSGIERGIRATYLVQGRERPEVFVLGLSPYSEGWRSSPSLSFQPMETEELPEGTEAFTDGERLAIALNEQTGYVAFVSIPGPADLALSDALMRLPISFLERAGNEATQTMDSSVDTGIAPLLAALPLRVSRLELMEIQLAEPGTSQLGAKVSYAAGPKQDATMELLVCPDTTDICLGRQRAGELTFVREQAPGLVTDTTLSGPAVTLFRAGEETRTSPGASIGATNSNPGLLASENETLVLAFAQEVSMEQFVEAV